MKTGEEVIFLGKKKQSGESKYPMVKGYIVKVIPPEDGGYVVIKPYKKALVFRELTCSTELVKGGSPKEGDDVVVRRIHKVSNNRWRSEKAIIINKEK